MHIDRRELRLDFLLVILSVTFSIVTRPILDKFKVPVEVSIVQVTHSFRVFHGAIPDVLALVTQVRGGFRTNDTWRLHE